MRGRVHSVSNGEVERPAPAPRGSRTGRRKRETPAEKRARAEAIAMRLASNYPGVECPLTHRNRFELLAAVMLSAQCTDAAVNRVTPELFSRFPTPEALADAPLRDLERVFRTLGLFRAKAKALKGCARQLVEEFGGRVPSAMEDLTRLAGVGRKTGNVLRGHAFALPGIAVDTHCKRLSRRLGLTSEEKSEKIERDLSRLLPTEEWTGFSHRLILHGRKICHAKKPACARCDLSPWCPSRAL